MALRHVRLIAMDPNMTVDIAGFTTCITRQKCLHELGLSKECTHLLQLGCSK